MGLRGPKPKLADMSEQELEGAIEEYFESRWDERTFHGKDGTTWTEPFMRPPTMAGLARHLGVVRLTLWRYLNRPEGDTELPANLKPALTRAMNRMAEFAEEATYTREGHNGARFALEINHRYGREEDGLGAGGQFRQVVIAPPSDDNAPIAIPKWEGDQE